MDQRFSVRAAAQERAARRRLIYLLLRNGDIGSLAGAEGEPRLDAAAIVPTPPGPDERRALRERGRHEH